MDDGRITAPSWWRVEINKAGNVKTCEMVEASERNSRTVLYIRAISRDDALEEATRWLERRRASARKSNQKMRALKKAKGQCEKCRQRICAESSNFCKRHRIEAQNYRRTYNAGERRAAPELTPTEAWAKETAYRERYRRMAVQLPVILAVFDQLEGRLTSAFRHWLLEEIEQRGGRSEAAQ